ncbi:MAG: hypothetical protein IT384_05735 [Deltaproteobacteria bacterium]|nr:hypothetical protein [Deltaproteobacteria bacterium]
MNAAPIKDQGHPGVVSHAPGAESEKPREGRDDESSFDVTVASALREGSSAVGTPEARARRSTEEGEAEAGGAWALATLGVLLRPIEPPLAPPATQLEWAGDLGATRREVLGGGSPHSRRLELGLEVGLHQGGAAARSPDGPSDAPDDPPRTHPPAVVAAEPRAAGAEPSALGLETYQRLVTDAASGERPGNRDDGGSGASDQLSTVRLVDALQRLDASVRAESTAEVGATGVDRNMIAGIPPERLAPSAPPTPKQIAATRDPESTEVAGHLGPERARLVLGEGADRVLVTVQSTPAQVNLRLRAGSLDVAEALVREQDTLREALSSHGLELASFEAGADRQHRSSDRELDEEDGPSARGTGEPRPSASTPAAGVRVIA